LSLLISAAFSTALTKRCFDALSVAISAFSSAVVMLLLAFITTSYRFHLTKLKNPTISSGALTLQK
jgi:hypothetical protein